MTTIWKDKLYMARHQPPIINTRVFFGREPDTIFFFYGITPSGRVSKYWAAYHTIPNFSKEVKLRGLDHYIKHRLPKLPKEYIWSEPRLYSGSL